MIRNLKIFFLLATSCIDSFCVSNSLEMQELDALISREMSEHHVVGMSIAVLKDQDIVYSKGFGFADKEKKIMADPYTIYRAGSISKLFTATAIMQLNEAKTIDIDAPLANILPNFFIRNRFGDVLPITPRMILTHHAGLPTDYIEGMWSRDVERFSTVIEKLHGEYTAFPPNTFYSYSNIGFTLLGTAIEQVTKTSYEQIMYDSLLRPLEMELSSFDSKLLLSKNVSKAYDSEGNIVEEPRLRDIPAGGLNTNVIDLLKFAKIWLNNGKLGNKNILSMDTVNEMFRPQNTHIDLDGETRVGLGWHFLPKKIYEGKEPIFFHDGSTINYNAILIVSPAHNVAIAMMGNTSNAMQPMMNIATHILKEMSIEDHVEKIIQTKRFPPIGLSDMCGRYMTPFGLIDIQESDGELSFKIEDTVLTLERDRDGYFQPKYRFLGMFERDIGVFGTMRLTRSKLSDHNVLIAYTGEDWHVVGEKIESNIIPIAWQEATGCYRYDGDTQGKIVPSEFVIEGENGFMTATFYAQDQKLRLALLAINDDEAILQGLGRGLGETVFIEKENGSIFIRYSGMIFQKIK